MGVVHWPKVSEGMPRDAMETDNVTISVVLWVMSAFEVYQLFALFTRNRHILKKMRQRE